MKKSNVVRSVTSFVGAIVLATSAWAVEPHVAPMTDFAKTEVANWIKTDVVISAIKDQNQKYANLAQADIDTLDKTWRAETSASDRPMINAVLASELSQFLATIREKSDGLVTEIFVMDNKYLGMVRQWQELFFDRRYSGVDLHGNPDFVKLAESYGVKGFRIKRSADVTRTLEKVMAYNDGPCLIHCEVEKEANVYPMIPAGAPYSKMLIEEPKEKLEKPSGST